MAGVLAEISLPRGRKFELTLELELELHRESLSVNESFGECVGVDWSFVVRPCEEFVGE